MTEEERYRIAQKVCVAYHKQFGKDAIQNLIFFEYQSSELFQIPITILDDFIADVNARITTNVP